MTIPLSVESDIHFKRRGRGSRRVMEMGPERSRCITGGTPSSVMRWQVIARWPKSEWRRGMRVCSQPVRIYMWRWMTTGRRGICLRLRNRATTLARVAE